MASCFIQIDKPFYFAGDTVQGNVFLNLNQNISANEVRIKFKGWESVRWIQQRVVPEAQRQQIQQGQIWHQGYNVRMDSSDSSSDEEDNQGLKCNYVMEHGQMKQIFRYSGGKIISRFSTVLHNFGGSYIPGGQYSFPFSFKTGEKYPASFKDKAKDKKRKGRIKYQMQAFIKTNNSKKKYVKHKTEIIMRESTAIKNEQKQMQAHVSSCCCIDQGISRIKCYFQKNAYSPGQQAKIYCMLDTSQSKTDITQVQVEMINQITYTSKDNHKKVFTNQLFTQRFPGLEKGRKGEGQQQVRIQNKSGDNLMNINPTARGDRLHSVYYLKVQAVLSASCTCCSDLPIVQQHILIYPHIPINQHFDAPNNWQPQSMPIINLQVAIEAQNSNLNSMKNPYY